MDEKQISKISLGIILTGLLVFILFYQNPFQEISIKELITNENQTGLIFGRITKIILNNENTLFILENDTSVSVFYPNAISVKENDFVYVYGKSQLYKGKKEIYAYKVTKDD